MADHPHRGFIIPLVGNKMPDGSIYLGYYQDRDWYVTDKDARYNASGLKMSFTAAARYASNLTVHGHADWVVPDLEILNAMYRNRHTGALKGTFNEKADVSYITTYYCSSRRVDRAFDSLWQKSFSNGHEMAYPEDDIASVRCVRSSARKIQAQA